MTTVSITVHCCW